MTEVKASTYFFKSFAFFGIFFACMFVAAGTWRLPFFWMLIGLWIILICECWFRLDRDLLSERMKPGGKDQDPHSVPLLLAVLIAHYSIAALDVGRFHFSDSVPFALQCVGTVLTYAGLEGLVWTMVVNRFFSSAIRLQEDRGQHVIDSGPYHYVRHPGYAFAAIAFLAEGMMLGSWLSIVPILLMVADFAYRALMEERLLKAELPGYSEYCERVLFRLCPGIW